MSLPVFLNLFDRGVDSIVEEFGITAAEMAKWEVLAAFYSYENYSGEAIVIAREKATGELHEVIGSHCSCYGLDKQWEPKRISAEYIKQQLAEGTSYFYEEAPPEFKKALAEIARGPS